MIRFRLSITAAFLVVGFFFLALPECGFSQESLSLGCCKTVKGTPACVGCGDGGLKCAIDASLCSETNRFSLDQVCAESSIAGQAECYEVQTPAGCCIDSENKCESDVNFDTCSGQHWFEGASCSDVPQCAASSSKDSPSLMQLLLIALAIVIVITGIREYRKNKSRA